VGTEVPRGFSIAAKPQGAQIQHRHGIPRRARLMPQSADRKGLMDADFMGLLAARRAAKKKWKQRVEEGRKKEFNVKYTLK